MRRLLKLQKVSRKQIKRIILTNTIIERSSVGTEDLNKREKGGEAERGGSIAR